MSIAIGVVATEGADRVRATIDHVRRHTRPHHDLWLLGDGPDADLAELVNRWPEERRSVSAEPQGMAACFNRLARISDAGILVLLEAGSLVSPGWLELLLRGLFLHPANGLVR